MGRRSMQNAHDTTTRIQAVRAAFPEGGFFRDKEWVLSPVPFALDARTVAIIEALGPALLAFQRACNQLYHESVAERAHPWVARLMDQGKPRRIIDLGRHAAWHDDLPRVIRPDLVLTENGVCISELDSLPGGIGLTAWLNQTYATLGDDVIGGASGMIDGFAAAFPDEDILISRESADYQPEMEWLMAQLNSRSRGRKRSVMNPWNVTTDELNGSSVYRFFELFDLDNVERSDELLQMALTGELRITPPLKAFLEEKLWLALFWVPQLEDWWTAALSTAHLQLLRECIPFGWIMNPQPLPVTAVYPELDINSWDEMKSFGRRQRELVVKISGFSERGWGSRGVFIGHDLSQDAWAAAIDEALASFPTNPFVLQRFHAGRVLNHPAWSDDKQAALLVKSRTRLCPYYFVADDEPRLSGVLATVCPADKKILHGMKDAMMLPCITAA
jgi:hypothetical protein